MGCFPVMVAAELRKLRGTALLPIGAVSGAAAIGISLYLAAADTTTAYTFPLFAGNVIANTMEELLPFTAALVVGQMMERERSCGTLKNIPRRARQLPPPAGRQTRGGGLAGCPVRAAAVGAVAGGLRAAGSARAHGRQRRLGAGHAAWQ